LGKLLSTNFVSGDHKFDFKDSSEDGKKQCSMVCLCGWEQRIESFENPWSVIEVKVKGNDHLKSVGIELEGVYAIFSFENY
jgi:hypothetical protein